MGLQVVREMTQVSEVYRGGLRKGFDTARWRPSDANSRTDRVLSRRGWELFDCYVDEGVSGKKDSRPELNRLMADAHARRFDVVVCGALTASHGRCHTCAVR